MAVTLDVDQLREAIRLGDSEAETAQVTRLLAAATTIVTRHVATAPDAIHNEAVIRVAGYLFDQPSSPGGANWANALRNSGAAAILLPYRIHRAGSISEAMTEAAAVGSDDNPVTGLAISGQTLTVTFADGSSVPLTLPAGGDGGDGVDQTARDAAAAAQTAAVAAQTAAGAAQTDADAAQADADTNAAAIAALPAPGPDPAEWAEDGNTDQIPASKLGDALRGQRLFIQTSPPVGQNGDVWINDSETFFVRLYRHNGTDWVETYTWEANHVFVFTAALDVDTAAGGTALVIGGETITPRPGDVALELVGGTLKLYRRLLSGAAPYWQLVGTVAGGISTVATETTPGVVRAATNTEENSATGSTPLAWSVSRLRQSISFATQDWAEAGNDDRIPSDKLPATTGPVRIIPARFTDEPNRYRASIGGTSTVNSWRTTGLNVSDGDYIVLADQSGARTIVVVVAAAEVLALTADTYDTGDTGLGSGVEGTDYLTVGPNVHLALKGTGEVLIVHSGLALAYSWSVFTLAGDETEGSFTKTTATVGSMRRGTPAELNPFSSDGDVTTAHGLGAVPHGVDVYLECLTAEHDYEVGDRVRPFQAGLAFSYDDTNTTIRSRDGNTPFVITDNNDRETITPARWKLVAVPFLSSEVDVVTDVRGRVDPSPDLAAVTAQVQHLSDELAHATGTEDVAGVLGSGNDSLRYSLPSTLEGVISLTVTVHLELDRNKFLPFAANEHLRLTIDGGLGLDTVIPSETHNLGQNFEASFTFTASNITVATGNKFLDLTADLAHSDDTVEFVRVEALKYSSITVRELPEGGTTGQLLQKSSGDDYDVEWGDAPSGGTTAITRTSTSLAFPADGVVTTLLTVAAADLAASTRYLLLAEVDGRYAANADPADRAQGTMSVLAGTTGTQTITDDAYVLDPVASQTYDLNHHAFTIYETPATPLPLTLRWQWNDNGGTAGSAHVARRGLILIPLAA